MIRRIPLSTGAWVATTILLGSLILLGSQAASQDGGDLDESGPNPDPAAFADDDESGPSPTVGAPTGTPTNTPTASPVTPSPTPTNTPTVSPP